RSGSSAVRTSTTAASRPASSARRCARRASASPAERQRGLTRLSLPPGRLQQDDRVHGERDREADGPAVQVALDERAAAQRALTGADAERAGQAGVLAR